MSLTETGATQDREYPLAEPVGSSKRDELDESADRPCLSAGTPKPHLLRVDPTGIPQDLVHRPQWVVWGLEPKPGSSGQWTKVPYRATGNSRRANPNSPASWSSFDAAYMAYEGSASYSGIGFALNGDGVVGLDLDHAVDEGDEVLPWAQEIIDRLPGAYVELSPSGRGLRAFCRGDLPAHGRRRTYGGGGLELYSDKRYLTVTGRALHPAGPLPDLSAEINSLHSEVFGARTSVEAEPVEALLTGPLRELDAEDRRILDRMRQGRDGGLLMRIYGGDYSPFDGDESRAELRLANALAFYCQKDAARIERMMRAGPWRPK